MHRTLQPPIPRTQLTGHVAPFHTATSPFFITPDELAFFEQLGHHLLSFYQAANQLYIDSFQGHQPCFVAEYLDFGKPESVVEYGRMNRFRQSLPGVIRPDLILTEDGMIATELDSIPGGIGLTSNMSQSFPDESLIGGINGMRDGFARMIRSLDVGARHAAPLHNPLLAIVVSEESKDYRSEMDYLGEALNEIGLQTFVLEPSEILFTEDGLWVNQGEERVRIDILYRFFELFDLKNIPKAELILYAAKKKQVVLTPPPKPQLEEKLLFALFHHPVLKSFWQGHLGDETVSVLRKLFPKTWILDPRPIPPHAIIPDLVIGDFPVSRFLDLKHLSQKERHFVIKPSGFSEMAWGSRGVLVGHDLSEEAFGAGIEMALNSFYKTPHILQEFHKGRQVETEYQDLRSSPSDKGGLEGVLRMKGRARLSPYYFVERNTPILSGILATICPLDKKLIHGMSDAVMMPCAVSNVGGPLAAPNQ
ncbi:MAG: hypothetical protein HY201_02090 [Nitrospirae bacterium]|nr:hypothetical protein [Candidatus Troglogloeales bacterium]MBI3598234.1 hypothetical protein [Candidatus Troglogloeales bacterium]